MAATKAAWKAYDDKLKDGYGTAKTNFDNLFTSANWDAWWAEQKKVDKLNEEKDHATAKKKILTDLKDVPYAFAQSWKTNKDVDGAKVPANADFDANLWAGKFDADPFNGLKALTTITAAAANTAEGDASTTRTDESNKRNSKDYLTKLEARDDLKAKWEAAVAAKAAVDDKITRLTKRRDHLRDPADTVNKGYIPELAKKKLDNENADKKLLEDIAAKEKELEVLTKAVTSKKTDMEDANKLWGEKKAAAEAKLKTYNDTHKKEVDALRETLALEVKAVNEAISAKVKQQELIDKENKNIASLDADLMAKLRVCKGENYDSYMKALAQRKADRQTRLEDIEKLIDGRKVIAHGATGGRCEKPQSNGDHLRRGKCASEADCCGAATGHASTGGPLMTIEVC